MKPTGLPSVEDMAANIVAVCSRATQDQVWEGMDWYDTARRLVRVIAQDTGVPDERVAYVLAALSPRNPWAWNVADAWVFCNAARRGDPMPIATTFKRNWVSAWAVLIDGADPWATSGAMKVRAFVGAIMGDTNSVVIDVWAVRAATNGERSEVRTIGAYRQIVAAYEIAAREVGYAPIVTQALAWVVTRGNQGIARPPKKGTPSFLVRHLTQDRGPKGTAP